jgi:hypothetical protein
MSQHLSYSHNHKELSITQREKKEAKVKRGLHYQTVLHAFYRRIQTSRIKIGILLYSKAVCP